MFGFYTKMTLHHHHPPTTTTTKTQCQQYFSCYWPDFDQPCCVGSWNPLEQIPRIMMSYVKATFVLTTFVHIRNISVVTDQILWIQLYGGLNNRTKILFGPKFCLHQTFFWPKSVLDPTFLGTNVFGPNIFRTIWTKKSFGSTNFLWAQILFGHSFLLNNN